MSGQETFFDGIFKDKTSGNRKLLTSEYLSQGLLPIVDQGQSFIAGYTNDIHAKCNIKLPCILFGDHTKKFQFQEEPFALGADGVKALEVNTGADPKYVYYGLANHRFPERTGYSRHFKYLKNAIFPLPPLEEQQRIAAILDKADALRRKRADSLKLADEFLKSVFLDMFGDPVTNEKGWEAKTIRDLLVEAKYGTSQPATESGEYIYLRMNNITYEGSLDLTNVKYIDAGENDFKKYSVQKGDVLFNRTNSKELVGKTCVFKEDTPMIIAGYIVRLRTNEKATPDYLSAFLNSKYGKQTLMGMCKSIVGQANINANEVQNIKIPLPPIDLQDKFAAIVQKVEAHKQRAMQGQQEADDLFNALQQQFFG